MEINSKQHDPLVRSYMTAFFNTVQDHVIFAMDEKRNVLAWNSAAEKILGYSEKEILGKSADLIFTTEDREKGVPLKEVGMAVKFGISPNERWHLCKSGVRIWGSGSISRIDDDKGQLAGFVKIFRDRTEQKKISDALSRSNRELEEFAYVAAHDLQAPLKTINNYCELLLLQLEGTIGEQARKLFGFIQDSVGRARRLIEDLLAYAKYEGKPRALAGTDFNRVVNRVIEILEFPIAESKAVITYDPLPTLRADNFKMVQLMENLISNAIKYRHKDRPLRIHVTSDYSGRECMFSVIDNGIGMAPEHHQKIFALFKRLHSESEYPGSGIGLSVCKKIVEAHGGRIWVESKSGEGSTFFFTLPVS